MAEVARRAKVAEQTMYFSFGSKAALLREVMIARRGPEDGPTEVMTQTWIQDALTAPDQRRAFAVIVEHGTEIFRRLAPVADAMTAAGLTDPDMAETLNAIATQRREGMSRMIAAIEAKGALAVTRQHATDVLDVVQSMATYNAFVRDCGWTAEHYKAWAYRALTQLLPQVTPARTRSLDAVATDGCSFQTHLESLQDDTSTARSKR
ncbi:MAG: hypothetical protein QOF21_1208 [Actinomycetota bacterium]